MPGCASTPCGPDQWPRCATGWTRPKRCGPSSSRRSNGTSRGIDVASRVLVALRVAATPERAFAAFTDDIGQWWRPNQLFQLTPTGPGDMAFEPGPGGRLVERQTGGGEYEVGRITLWDPPAALKFQWRPASFSPEQST